MKKSTFLKIFLAVFIAALLAAPVLAQNGDFGLGLTAGEAGLTKHKDLPTLIGNVIGTALSLVAIIFFALMLYSGIMWMTSRGNEEQAKKALNGIFAAIIGIIIVLASYAITNFVFKSVGKGTPVTAPGQTCTQKHPTWQCRDIMDCNITGDTKEAKLANCTGSNCETGLCPGGTYNVCCLATATGLPPLPEPEPEPEPTCADGVQYCTTESDCKAQKHYWYNNTCNAELCDVKDLCPDQEQWIEYCDCAAKYPDQFSEQGKCVYTYCNIDFAPETCETEPEATDYASCILGSGQKCEDFCL